MKTQLNWMSQVFFLPVIVVGLMGRAALSATELAQRSKDFTASAGVATHLSYTDTSYWNHFCTPKVGVVDSLLELGVTKIRDGVTDSRLAKVPAAVKNYQPCNGPTGLFDYGYYRQLIKDRVLMLSRKGIQIVTVAGGGAITNTATQNDLRDRIIPDLLSIQTAIFAIQTHNEPNIARFGFRYNKDGFVALPKQRSGSKNQKYVEQGQGWSVGTRNYIRDLSHTIRKTPSLRSKLIFGPAIAYGWGPDRDAFKERNRGGNLETALVPFSPTDKRIFGSLHNYNAFGQQPGAALMQADGSFDWWFRLVRGEGNARSFTPKGNYPTIPLVATETGYSNRAANDSNPSNIPEWVSTRYIPRRLLENFRQGIRFSFLYELMDTFPPGQAHGGFGLIRGDLSRRPSFYTLKHLLNLLKDDDRAFTPGSLNYAIAAPKTASVHRLLLQKSNGDFYLILWNEVRNWDGQAAKILRPPAADANLQVNTSGFKLTQYRYDANDNYKLVASDLKLNASRIVKLSVPDIPIVIKLSKSS
jgi:hypothetical protein